MSQENTVTVEEPSDDEAIETLALDALKSRARTLGIQFHPSIGAEKLAEKVAAKLAEDAPEATPETTSAPAAVSQPSISKLSRNPARALIRVRIVCMDPAKKEYDGDIFSVSNSKIGTIKRYIPFGYPWHVESMLLELLREKKYQAFHEVKLPNGTKIKRGRLISAYAIEVLAPLTTTEMQELKQRQLSRQGGEGL